MHELVLSQRGSGSGERWLHLPEKGHALNSSIRICNNVSLRQASLLCESVTALLRHNTMVSKQLTRETPSAATSNISFYHSESLVKNMRPTRGYQMEILALISWCWLEDSWTRRISADDSLAYTDVHLTRSASRPDQHSCGPGLLDEQCRILNEHTLPQTCGNNMLSSVAGSLETAEDLLMRRSTDVRTDVQSPIEPLCPFSEPLQHRASESSKDDQSSRVAL